MLAFLAEALNQLIIMLAAYLGGYFKQKNISHRSAFIKSFCLFSLLSGFLFYSYYYEIGKEVDNFLFVISLSFGLFIALLILLLIKYSKGEKS